MRSKHRSTNSFVVVDYVGGYEIAVREFLSHQTKDLDTEASSGEYTLVMISKKGTRGGNEPNWMAHGDTRRRKYWETSKPGEAGRVGKG
jgi:hypothetical protein